MSKRLTLSKRQNLDFQTFRLDEIGRTFSKRLENTVGKREIARLKGSTLSLPNKYIVLFSLAKNTLPLQDHETV